MALAISTILIASLLLHFGSGVRGLANVRDEHLMKVPIDTILSEGWSIRTAIDYQEVKGPAFYWMYALPGEVTGNSINAMRLVSIGWFVLGGAAIVSLCGRGGVRGRGLLVIAVLYSLAPYNLFTAQLLFSEPSFHCIGLWMMYAFVRGFDAQRAGDSASAWVAAFAMLFAILLHHRPHALALGGAAAMTALVMDPRRAWPWWVACIIAGVARIPLYLRWGGMVTSDYQDLFGFGFRLDGVLYMLAAALPWTAGWLLLPLSSDASEQRATRLRWMAITFGIVCLLAAVNPPDLNAKVTYLTASAEPGEQAAFAGAVATGVKAIAPPGLVRSACMALLSGLGAASLAGFALCILPRATRSQVSAQPLGVASHLAFFTLACGLPLYIVSSGPVYDRYLAVWMGLMPLAWLMTLPRWLVISQSVVFVAMLVMHTREYLVP